METVAAVAPSKALSPDALARKAQLLRQSVTRRLTMVDSGWLKRCQVFDEVENRERPVTGNVSPVGGGGASVSDGNGPAATPARPSKADLGRGAVTGSASEPPARDGCPRSARVAAPAKTPPSGPLLKAGVEDGDEETRWGRTGEACAGADAVGTVETRQPPARDGEETRASGPEEKGAKRQSRKRRRVVDGAEGEGPDVVLDGTATKRRRTRKGLTESPSAPRGRTKAGKVAKGDDGDPEPPASSGKKAKPKVPQHNILGEEEQEDIKAASARLKNTVKVRYV